jgi:hypothetical protein
MFFVEIIRPYPRVIFVASEFTSVSSKMNSYFSRGHFSGENLSKFHNLIR